MTDINNLREQAKASQRRILKRLKSLKKRKICFRGSDFWVYPGVYDTGLDTELQVQHIKPKKTDILLDIGCGAGIASVLLAEQAKFLTGTDINSLAIKNAQANAALHRVENVEFLKADCFPNKRRSFDIIICNPPYTDNLTSETFERMFWDPNSEMKKKVLKNTYKYLNPGGKLYFASANFAAHPNGWIINLAEQSGLKYVQQFTKKGKHNRDFYLLEFSKLA